MIDAIDTLNAQFQDLGDTLAGVDLGAVEDAGWALLFTIERLDRRLPVLPDTNPDFTSAGNAQELAGIEEAAWSLLFTIERLDRRLPVLPDTHPDLTQCSSTGELAPLDVCRLDSLRCRAVEMGLRP